jgi:FixJ family two-component response regulator
MKQTDTDLTETTGVEDNTAPRPLVAIVDDDESVRTAVGSLFRSMGFRTKLFGGGKDFLDFSNVCEVSCLILDVQMPGMDGLELQRRLASVRHHIPVVFITAYGDENARAQALREGAVDFLSKPFSEDALLDAVKSIIEVGIRN